MADIEILAAQGDERTALLGEDMEVVLPRFESVCPADALPDDGGVDAVTVAHEHAVDAGRVQVVKEALGGAENGMSLAVRAEIAGLGGHIHAEDVLGRDLVALGAVGQKKLGRGDVEAHDAGDGRAAVRVGQALGGGAEPLHLVGMESGGDAVLGGIGPAVAVGIHHVEDADRLTVAGHEDGIVAVSGHGAGLEQAIFTGLPLPVLPMDAPGRGRVVVAVDGCPRDPETVHKIAEGGEETAGIVEFAVHHIARDENEVGRGRGDQRANVVEALHVDALGLPVGDLPLVETVGCALLGRVDDLHVGQLENANGAVTRRDVHHKIHRARKARGEGKGSAVDHGSKPPWKGNMRSGLLQMRKRKCNSPAHEYYFRNPLMICSSASFSVRPRVMSLMSCSPAILPMAASWISDASVWLAAISGTAMTLAVSMMMASHSVWPEQRLLPLTLE